MKKTLILALILLCASITFAQGPPVQVAPVAHQIFLATNGAPLVSGCVTTSISGSNTPQTTYTDSTALTANSNPIILGADGGADIWMTNVAYRFTVVAYDGIPGNKCAAGVQQYVRDGINPWNVINLANNFFLASNTSDPSGTAGEMTYRSDIPCFRFFTTFWDCVVRLTDTQTLTNKTLTSPTINTPTIATANLTGITSVNGVQALNTSGTTLQVGGNAASSVTLFAGNDTISPGNVTVTAGTASGAGTGGNVTVTAGNGGNLHGGFVTITGGNGTANNANGGNVAIVPGTGNGSGTAGTIALQGIVANYNNVATVGNGVPAEYGKGDATGQGANVGVTTLYVVPATGAGMYRASCYVIVTTAATTSSTLPSCNLIWTDNDNSNNQSANVTATQSGNTVTTYAQGATIISVKASTSVTWSTAGYATSGAHEHGLRGAYKNRGHVSRKILTGGVVVRCAIAARAMSSLSDFQL